MEAAKEDRRSRGGETMLVTSCKIINTEEVIHTDILRTRDVIKRVDTIYRGTYSTVASPVVDADQALWMRPNDNYRI